jgi:glucose-6-phosphate 1-dehydrogenase
MATRVEALTAPAVRTTRPAPPCAMVVFGGTGDLARRKLVPALYNLAADRTLPEHFAMIGLARTAQTSEQYREAMRAAVSEFSRRPLDPEVWSRFASALDYESGAFEDDSSFGTLSRLQQLDYQHGLEGNRLSICDTAGGSETFVGDLAGRLIQRRAAALVARHHRKPFGPT